MTTRPLLAALACCLLLTPAARCDEPTAWWLQQRRMLQTNLREIDATMDVDKYIKDVAELGAEVVLFNVGGIVANYPTDLEYHWKNTYMEGDLVGTVLKRLHAKGIRMIGRFDFSKINEKYAKEHPEWLYVGEDGEHVNYNGQVHTCVSGAYQQQYMLDILGEAIDRYPLDGVFFNMIGYQRGDYSGNYHGICQCENCRLLFKEYSGLELPATQSDSLQYRKYLEWTRMMIDRQFRRVNVFLKTKRPDLAICTYTTTGVDIIRKESNRPRGQGTYYDTDKAKWTLLTCGERQLANAAVHFIEIPYRHAAVSPYLTARRLWQQMVNGAWLDFYCIGPLQRQEDRTNLQLLKEIFQFHKEHQKWLVDSVPAGQIGVVRQGDDEYQGVTDILSESQFAYELTRVERDQLRRYSVVIVPSAEQLTAKQARVIDQYVAAGGKLLMTGKLPQGMDCMGNSKFRETMVVEKGGYLRIRPEDRVVLREPILQQLDLVFLRGPFHIYEPGDQGIGMLRLIPPDMFGPPEKCYYREVSDHPALLAHPYKEGWAACFPFALGSMYHQQAHQGHAALLRGVIDNLLLSNRRLQVIAPPLVEVDHRADRDRRFEWVSLYNHSGARGSALHAPIPISGVEVRLQTSRPVKSVRSLATDRPLTVTEREDNTVSVTLDSLNHYDIVLFEY